MSMLASVQLVMIGILGEYVGRIYEQVKQRPIYVIRQGAEAPHTPAAVATPARADVTSPSS
jgi:dolichol-phosphate mannosyltransferase